MNNDELLAEYEKSTGLPEGFIRRLGQEGDDWSFTIKAHALIETGLTELLLHHIGRQELDDLLSRLPISGHFSKRTVIKALDGLGDNGETDRFIDALGTIRNRLVHSIKLVDFSLAGYFRELSEKNPEAFHRQHDALDLVFGREESVEVRGRRVTAEELFINNARLIIATGLGSLLSRIHVLTRVAKSQREIREQGAQLYNDLIRTEILRSLSGQAEA